MYLVPTDEEIDDLVHSVLNEFANEIINELELITSCEEQKIARKEIAKIINRTLEEKDNYFYEVTDM